MKIQLKEFKCKLTLSLTKVVMHKLIEFLDRNNDCHQAISQIWNYGTAGNICDA
jgi:hypothetical protein